MESRNIAYKWRPDLWNHVKLHTNGGQSYGITKNSRQMETRPMESRKINTNEGQSYGILNPFTSPLLVRKRVELCSWSLLLVANKIRPLQWLLDHS